MSVFMTCIPFHTPIQHTHIRKEKLRDVEREIDREITVLKAYDIQGI